MYLDMASIQLAVELATRLRHDCDGSNVADIIGSGMALKGHMFAGGFLVRCEIHGTDNTVKPAAREEQEVDDYLQFRGRTEQTWRLKLWGRNNKEFIYREESPFQVPRTLGSWGDC